MTTQANSTPTPSSNDSNEGNLKVIGMIVLVIAVMGGIAFLMTSAPTTLDDNKLNEVTVTGMGMLTGKLMLWMLNGVTPIIALALVIMLVCAIGRTFWLFVTAGIPVPSLKPGHVFTIIFFPMLCMAVDMITDPALVWGMWNTFVCLMAILMGLISLFYAPGMTLILFLLTFGFVWMREDETSSSFLWENVKSRQERSAKKKEEEQTVQAPTPEPTAEPIPNYLRPQNAVLVKVAETNIKKSRPNARFFGTENRYVGRMFTNGKHFVLKEAYRHHLGMKRNYNLHLEGEFVTDEKGEITLRCEWNMPNGNKGKAFLKFTKGKLAGNSVALDNLGYESHSSQMTILLPYQVGEKMESLIQSNLI